MPVTRADVARLATRTHLAPSEFVALRTPDEVDVVGEPESLIDLREGLRVLVLAQKDGACVFLQRAPDGSEGCSVHPARPSSCRAYPFDRPDSSTALLGLHPGTLCPKETGHEDVLLQDDESARAFASVVALRDRELSLYASWLEAFNRRQRLRRRLQKPGRGREQFLALLLADETADEPSGVLDQDAPNASDVAGAEQVDVHE